MTIDSSEHLTSQMLQGLVGKRLGPYCSFNPVSRPQVWQWCSVMGDENPLYLDDKYRERTEFRGSKVVAPPAMMQMWTMRDINMRYAGGSTAAEPYEIIYALQDRGFAGNVAVSYDITFYRYLVEGDRVHHYKEVASVSDLKKTALGEGYFFTDKEQYFDQHGEVFAEALVSYFQYRPEARQRIKKSSAADGDMSQDKDLHEGGDMCQSAPEAQAGQRLPGLSIPLTHELIVGGAIATQDFTPVHHNLDAAIKAGSENIFMNILTTTGLSARYLSDWAGPESRLRKLSLRLLAPNYPGDTMQYGGCVADVTRTDATMTVGVDFAGDNQFGQHVVGRATLDLPA